MCVVGVLVSLDLSICFKYMCTYYTALPRTGSNNRPIAMSKSIARTWLLHIILQ